MNLVDFTLRGPVAVVVFANPPVNSLSYTLRRELADAVDRANGQPAVKAIVLSGRDGKFSAGADIREFGTPAALKPPSLRQLIALIEASEKPVIAAIAGICLGGGLELALGCHYRIASRDAKLGLPEVKLGLLPGAGGTQRLPRLLGFEAALNVIVSGEPVAAAIFAKTPLLDRVVDGEPLAPAIALANRISRESPSLRVTRSGPRTQTFRRRSPVSMRSPVRRATSRPAWRRNAGCLRR